MKIILGFALGVVWSLFWHLIGDIPLSIAHEIKNQRIMLETLKDCACKKDSYAINRYED